MAVEKKEAPLSGADVVVRTLEQQGVKWGLHCRWDRAYDR
jgi:hypothetical protein